MRAASGIAGALCALVADDLDVSDVLAHLMADASVALGAQSVALMVLDGDDLALLATSSHRAGEVEMLQAQRATGPCVDVIATGRPVRVGERELASEHWGDVGPAIASAGYAGVAAFPMRWRGRTLGGLNVFVGGDADLDATLAQAYADVCTLVVVQAAVGPVAPALVTERLREALVARDLVEQAKGVLAHTEGVDLETAYRRLLERSSGDAASLSRVAADVVRRRGAGGDTSQ